ncbi:DUF3833 domain-containing protein [Ruegeria sediminis]|uniref:DUF3833 domain-containing protein n=1 Tax=Ruegeria sediminis TaxID=2583820 RepID=A0ABY2WTF2_9RHOB|nr:DUF3833 domain-containing protein [Ruegeria sediminis]TMV04807.1 DUF3833 domain-containing protein [Ruegeria sediminis]
MEPFLFMLLGAALALACALAASRVIGFSAQRPEDYQAMGPQFDLRRHLNGPIACEGVIFGPTGRVASRFQGDMRAEWEGNAGTMTEHFAYDTGTVQSRLWQLRLGNDGRIEATAGDVVGTGQGTQMGSAVQMRYRIRLPESAGGHVVDVVDWMYLAPGGVIVNRSQFRKFGIKVAELVAVMRPADQDRMAA